MQEIEESVASWSIIKFSLVAEKIRTLHLQFWQRIFQCKYYDPKKWIKLIRSQHPTKPRQCQL